MNPDTRTTTVEDAKSLGLTAAEYEKICHLLNRAPNYTELGVYSVMWSEHCSYKNSIAQLKLLPRSGARLLVEAGQENAGLVDIGDGYAICFKIESHNHPSAVEPYQGAATGVGGILRDIFTMGARPIAALDSLRFGKLDNERTKLLFEGVVKGIGDYGNSFGVPTVGGEVFFEDCYRDNPLVNAMAVGIVKAEQTASATSGGAGKAVMILGARTGRDGIHGASLLASREFDEKTEDMRPTVQVGDPFYEKMLLEASLELIASGIVVGMQDMGAAGISCSTSEMSEKGGTGMKVNLDLVPLREDDMSAYEIMLSESQERMLLVLEEEDIPKAEVLCEKWDVPITRIGETTEDGNIELYHRGELVAHIPAESLVLGGGAPVYIREQKEASYLQETRSADPRELIGDITPSDAFNQLLESPNIASKHWVYEQYDSMVRTNTAQSFDSDAAVIRLKEVPGKGLAVATDCNSRYVYLNPWRGGAIAVAEAARNVACSGATPVAITNCLNFGNPYNPEVYWQFAEALRGMGDACRTFDTPVTGGNVSFHNESQEKAVFPTPTIGMLGIIEDLNHVTPAGFRQSGDMIALLGNIGSELGGSELLSLVTGKVVGDAPEIDLQAEKNLQSALLKAIRSGLISSAHDPSEGGIAIALAESSINSLGGNLGANVEVEGEDQISALFGESQSRVVVSFSPEGEESVKAIAGEFGVPYCPLGHVTEGSFTIGSAISTTVAEMAERYNGAIEKRMGGELVG
ncbi:MAG: phosphoribosylformylglycinamidine synthase subunit PurL [Ignavibacteriae bacterium]|nr:phosphoribosylformylglycinamidine synthase subunit PurL [Ignavibacteriota bacterium]MCB9216099.1 phosphoribosylformylglycinamidine synthase subunit PurL [Ignavibacteria bacterium]